MSKARAAKVEADELRPEYRFDYTKSKPNRFASLFSISEAVNEAPGQ